MSGESTPTVKKILSEIGRLSNPSDLPQVVGNGTSCAEWGSVPVSPTEFPTERKGLRLCRDEPFMGTRLLVWRPSPVFRIPLQSPVAGRMGLRAAGEIRSVPTAGVCRSATKGGFVTGTAEVPQYWAGSAERQTRLRPRLRRCGPDRAGGTVRGTCVVAPRPVAPRMMAPCPPRPALPASRRSPPSAG
jgi:hypothetical protein